MVVVFHTGWCFEPDERNTLVYKEGDTSSTFLPVLPDQVVVECVLDVCIFMVFCLLDSSYVNIIFFKVVHDLFVFPC